MVKNCAFCFIKPHAVTDKVKALVKEICDAKGIEIKKQGSLDAEEIDKKMLIDNHYYAIASKATLLTPDKLNVPKEKFKAKFDLDWDEALKTGNVVNAKDAAVKLGLDADGLDAKWAEAKKAKNLEKFGGGFYCAKIGELYVFNGFFMSMRSKFTAPGASIYYYVVEWESDSLSWEDFRCKVLGPTDPVDAPADSMRGRVLKDWRSLDLTSEPNTGDNAVHASASPFEALAERMNWLGYRAESDPFGKRMLKAGISRRLIKEWSKDPQVTYGPIPMTKSLYDSLEDTDSDYCLALCQMIAHSQTDAAPKDEKKVKALEAEVEALKAELDQYKTLQKAIQIIQQYVPKEPKGVGKGKDPQKGSSDGGGGKGKGKGKTAESEQKSKPKRTRKGRK